MLRPEIASGEGKFPRVMLTATQQQPPHIALPCHRAALGPSHPGTNERQGQGMHELPRELPAGLSWPGCAPQPRQKQGPGRGEDPALGNGAGGAWTGAERGTARITAGAPAAAPT